MSKHRKLRNKLSFDEDEAGDGAPPPPPPPGKKESSKPKKSTLLSFEDDEEAAIAPSKSKKEKSKTSKFHRANIISSTAASDVAAAQKPAAGEYTAEKLAALQAATQKLPSKFKPPPVEPSLDSSATAAAAGTGPAGVIKLSGSFKNAAKAKDDRFSYSYSITGQISSGKDVLASKSAAPAAQRERADDAMPLPPPPRPGSAAGQTDAAVGTGSIKAAHHSAAAAGGGNGHRSGGESSDDDDSNGFLPDKETIRLAKAKRERLRQAHLAPDYVPLGGAGRLLGTAVAAGSGPGRGLLGNLGVGPESRGEGADEMDDDQGLGGSDNEGSEPGSDAEQELEERMRMTFVGQQQPQQQPQRGSSKHSGSSSRKGAAAAALAGGHYASTVQDDYEHDDASDEDMSTADVAAAAGPEGQQQQLAKAIRRNAGGKNRSWLAGLGGTAAAGIGDRTAAVQAAGAGVLSALMEATNRALGRQKHLEQNLSRTTANLQGALEEVERVRADIAATSEKYTTVQSLKAYLSDLADCLADKAILVEEMQDSLEQAREDAATAARRQERDDEAVLLAQAEAAVTAALAVLGRGGAAAAAAAAAETAAVDAEAAAVAAAATSKVEVDEFGRDMGLMRRKELEKGKSRRDRCVMALLEQLQEMRQGGRLNLDDAALRPAAAVATQPSSSSGSAGSTIATSDDPEAVQQYKRRRQDILDLIPTVFADTDEQYASLAAVKARLERFKAQYPKEYGTAYIGDSAAALFAPFVRLQLLQWEPMPIGSSSSSEPQANGVPQQQQQQQPTGFDTQEWYQQLFEYGLAVAGGAAAAATDDADANLVPQLVESLVLPLALHLVARCWEPSNTAQSKAVAFLVSELFVYVPADKEDMAQLLALTTGTLEAAVAAAAVPPWPAAAAAASPVAQAVLQLRFRRTAALLQGLLGFSDLLSQQMMFRLALQGLMVQQLVPCLRSSFADLGVAVARAEAVVVGLPVSWFKDGPVPREAQSLLDVLASLGRSIEAQYHKQQPDGGGAAADCAASATSLQALVGYARRVAVLLLHVGLKEQAQRLSQLN